MEQSEEVKEAGKAGLRTTQLTVSALMRGRHFRPTPRLQIVGLWLAALGWRIGERVVVEADKESILISRVPARASQVADAELYPDEFGED